VEFVGETSHAFFVKKPTNIVRWVLAVTRFALQQKNAPKLAIAAPVFVPSAQIRIPVKDYLNVKAQPKDSVKQTHAMTQ
jgi:hypothetical protein